MVTLSVLVAALSIAVPSAATRTSAAPDLMQIPTMHGTMPSRGSKAKGVHSGASAQVLCRSVIRALLSVNHTLPSWRMEEGMAKVREFANTWDRNLPPTWTEREESELVGSSKGGHLHVPCFRPFDFLTGPNQPLTYLASVSSRIGVDAPRGADPHFHRNVDFDTLLFQWAGETSYETEFGTFTAKPAELLLIPGGVAHSWTGSSDSLRLVVHLRDPLEVLCTAEKHVGETDYRVTWVGGPTWAAPPVPPKAEMVLENLHTWDDRAGDETVVE